MSLKNYRILSLDISSTSTGWSFMSNKTNSLRFGTIKPLKTLDTANKLCYFRQELIKLFKKYKPNYVVLEDTFLGSNPKVVKLLAKFGGVAEQAVLEQCSILPYIMGNTTPKSFFKVKCKKDLFSVIIDLIDSSDLHMPFAEWNDVTDSIAQLLCYCDEILDLEKIRMDKDYGFKYEF